MISPNDRARYYANRSQYRQIKIEGDQFSVYVYGHYKQFFDSLDAAVAHRDKLTSAHRAK